MRGLVFVGIFLGMLALMVGGAVLLASHHYVLGGIALAPFGIGAVVTVWFAGEAW